MMLLKGLLGIPSTGETRWVSNQWPFWSRRGILGVSSPKCSGLKWEQTAYASRKAESALCAESADLPSPGGSPEICTKTQVAVVLGRPAGRRCSAGGIHLQSLFKCTISFTTSHADTARLPLQRHCLEDALTKQSLESARPSGGVRPLHKV